MYTGHCRLSFKNRTKSDIVADERVSRHHNKENHMKRIKYFVAVGIAILIMGCPARSLFPLFIENDLVFNPTLVGTWVDEKNKDTFTFQKSAEKSYNVVGRDQKGDTVIYKVQLGKLGRFWFLDSYPGWKIGDHHIIATHIISKMWLEGDTLRIASLESDWLKKMIDSGKLKVSHALVEGDVILTASTKELQQLVLRFAEDNDAFPKPGKFIRMK